MSKVITLLIIEIINGFLEYLGDDVLKGIMPIALHAEKYLKNIGIGGLSSLFKIFLDFGISMIILKFLKKGFEVYVMWTDGDADVDPVILLSNFFKAIALALSFPTIYTWLTDIINEITDKTLEATGLNKTSDFSSFTDIFMNDIATAGIFSVLVILVFLILFVLLWIQFIKRGLELLILRIGFPLVCTGLMDADKGVFKPYVQKLLQATITVLVQITLAKLSLTLIMGQHLIWGIASVSLAINTPKLLQEFLINVGGAGGMMNTAYSTARLVQMVKKAT